MSKLKLYLIVLIVAIIGCENNNIPSCNDTTGLFTLSKYPIGCAIDFNELNSNPIYKEIAIRQFNSITAENIFKPEYLHPEADLFSWDDADVLANFCKTNNKRLHGHTLIWHQQLPYWIENFIGNSAEWELLMKKHIQTIVHHFKDKVHSWDVVNEAFDEDGTLRNSIWREKIGDSYIEKAYQFAHEADTNALLFYNDYNLETNPKKLKSTLAYLNKMRNKGIKIDGIGLQMHLSIALPETPQISYSMNEIVQNDYMIHISEMDISVNPENEDINPDSDLFTKQAYILSKIVLYYNQLPPKYQYGLTFWGISDKNSWIRNYYNKEDYPLLYDDNYQPKPMYCKLKELL